jgi:putative acetyltransferase
VLIRREAAGDIGAIAAVTTAAFAPGAGPGDDAPVETTLIAELRASDAWLAPLSLVAVGEDDGIVGHVVCSRGHVGAAPALGLGPISVHPDRQGTGVGKALMHAVLGAADALGEPVVLLLGEPGFYARFGFRPAGEIGIAPPIADWISHFQARTLHAWDPALRGTFVYAAPFGVS